MKRSAQPSDASRTAAIVVFTILMQGVSQAQERLDAGRKPRVWTIAVGAGTIANDLSEANRFAARDAARVAQWSRRAGWSPGQILLVSDRGSVDPGRPDAPSPNLLPTKQNLEWAIREWLLPKTQAGDVLLFYFAGKTRAKVTPRGANLPAEIEYLLLTSDGSEAEPRLDGWPLERALDLCASRKLKVVCFLETCIPEPHGLPAQGEHRPPLSLDWLARLTRWPRATAWLASERGSIPAPGDSGPVFTSTLLDALGTATEKPSLASTLALLHESPGLRDQGFRTMGGPAPGLTLWADRIEPDHSAPDPDLVLQFGHGDKVLTLAATADGQEIFTGSLDSTVRVWSVPDHCLKRVIAGQTVGVTSILLSRDERWLVTGGGRGAVFVYNRQQDYARRAMIARQPHHERIVQLAMLPDGDHFVSIDRTGHGHLWDLRESSLAPRSWPDLFPLRAVAASLRPQARGVSLVALGDGPLRAFESFAAPWSRPPLSVPDPQAVALSSDGRIIAAARHDGAIAVYDFDSQREAITAGAAQHETVRKLVFAPSGLLAAASDRRLRLITSEGDNAALQSRDLLVEPCATAAFSLDSSILSTCTTPRGSVHAWRVSDSKRPQVITTRLEGASAVGFTGDSKRLVAGGFEGDVHMLTLAPDLDRAAWSAPANRGRFAQVVISPSRKLVLTVDELRRARLWDVPGRSCRELPGTWGRGAILNDEHLVLLPGLGEKGHGLPVLVDREPFRVRTGSLAGKAGEFAIPEALGFEQLALSSDGAWIAAAADTAKTPLVCVWNAKTGRLVRWITGDELPDAVFSLAFDPTGGLLLTAGDAPEARLWDLSGPEGPIKAPKLVFADPEVTSDATVAIFRPDRPAQVVTGHRDGQVHVWTAEAGKPTLIAQSLVAGTFAGKVSALTFVAGGRYLAVAGDSASVWIGTLEPAPQPLPILEKLRPHHLEQVTALAGWSDRPLLVTAGDDATLRFWDLEQGKRMGLFATAQAPVVPGAIVRELDWVYCAADGRFDSSPGCLELVRFRRQDRPERLPALEKTHLVYGLAGVIDGEATPVLASLSEPEPIAVSGPPARATREPRIALEITLASENLKDVRLYHNDTLVPSGFESARPGELRHRVVVRLLPGINRFYAMAGRVGALDSASGVIEVDYLGEPVPGRVHVLALGVGDYKKNRLGYPRRDAERLSDFLHERGVDNQGQGGLQIVLPDSLVSAQSVEDAFEKLSIAVEDRPQDTIVVFIACHTGVFNPQRFCLLLSNYPFGEDQPAITAARGGIIEDDRIDSKYVLPYANIEAAMARLKALNRLVIVDACQAESIQDDPRVRGIQQWMERTTRRARTSYLMAARRGEPALEVEPLSHGLFTFTILRGAGAGAALDEPREIQDLKLPPNADFNHDKLLSTNELDAYVKQAMPQISAIFPQLVNRARGGAPLAHQKAAKPPDLDQKSRVQGSDLSFTVIPLAPPTNNQAPGR